MVVISLGRSEHVVEISFKTHVRLCFEKQETSDNVSTYLIPVLENPFQISFLEAEL